MKANKTNFKEAITVLSDTSVAHVVAGKEFKFYPVSVATLFRMRTMAKPLASALRTLFGEKNTDRASTQRQAGGGSEIVIAPIAPELAKLRSEQAEKAISDVIEAFTDDKNATVIGELLVDSLRDEFDRGGMDEKACLAFVRGMDAVVLADMIVGLAKGNKKILGPFGEILSATATQIAAQVTSALAQLQAPKTETAS